MDITGISGGISSQGIDATQTFHEWADKKLRFRGDTVTISDEARYKAEEAAKAKIASETTLPGEEDAAASGSAGGAGASGGGAASGADSEDQIQDIESRIKALADQLANIMQGSLPLETRMQQAQPVQQQISALAAQLSQLKAQIMQEKSG